MGLKDRVENRAQDVAGRGKEAAGAAMDDDKLRAEGRTDQVKAGIKDKVEDVKDKVEDVKDKIEDKVDAVNEDDDDYAR